jgi:hypothetical protein
MNPDGRFTFIVLRPMNDMVLWLWRWSGGPSS